VEYLLGLAVATMLVIAQAIWKVGVEKHHFSPDAGYLLSSKMVSFIVSPEVIGGVMIYVVATLFYMAMLAKYPYALVQTLVVPTSLLIAYLVARTVFHERLSLMNYLGMALLLVGVVLVTRR
jgi:drug/metabolite transporter (DMT)-like permease